MSSSLVPVPNDTSSPVRVLQLLGEARAWLATAVEISSAAEIAANRVLIATAADVARRLQLSKEIQNEAAELVRRSEFKLGKAIRKGQAEGTILRPYENQANHNQHSDGAALHEKQNGEATDKHKARVTDFARHGDLYGGGARQPGIYALADDVSPEVFEIAIGKAKAEGNLSRPNVIRKIKGQAATFTTRQQRADLISDLADQGYASRQMPTKVGISEDSIRKIARDYGIEIPADRTIAGTRRPNSTQIAIQTVTALEGLVMGVELIDYDALDLDEAGQWAASLTASLKALNRFATQIRKATQ